MRQSAFRGNWSPNKRPFVTFAPDCYVSFQGETTVIGCGECKRKVNFNDYITQISTEASVDSPPGSATVQMSIPDNSKNDFYVDGQFLIIPMMEIEIYAKGYYLIGGVPQYYRIFWGIVQTVTKNWSNGVTSISISCRDILRWWELTYTTLNPAFTEGFGSSAGHYQLFQNQFAGQNPYATIIQLAKDSMGDFLLTTGSLNQNYRPEKGSEAQVIGSFAKDIMTYWQLKFANIQSSLVLFGASGQAYTFSGVDQTVSPNQIADQIFKEEFNRLKNNLSTDVLFSSPKQVATAKKEISRAGETEFFQANQQSKLTLALQARDQIGFEFYCDTTGDIVFKPPFYNLNVLPNKPVSWIQDFDIIDDSVVDSEAEVVTHVTASGNAFGGVTDWGLSDETTTPRTGVYDFHLLKRYGWRRAELQLEWAGNPRKLFFHLLDWMDRLNARRQNGTMTIPMRPELKMGFPVWVPKYDSFFYVNGISHQYSVGGQATTSIQLIAKRSKFIAPQNIGTITKTNTTRQNQVPGQKGVTVDEFEFKVEFPDEFGSTSGLTNSDDPSGKPLILRDPDSGKLLGYPNVVMVFRNTINGQKLLSILETEGKRKSKVQGSDQNKKINGLSYDSQMQVISQIQAGDKDKLITSVRAHRYEAGMTNAGAYDYAYDKDGIIKELNLRPISSITTNTSGEDSNTQVILDSKPDSNSAFGSLGEKNKNDTSNQENLIKEIKSRLKTEKVNFSKLNQNYNKTRKKTPPTIDGTSSTGQDAIKAAADMAAEQVENTQAELASAEKELARIKSSFSSKILPSLNVIVRPVSDEFGFEVIGHYRYGRGSYIDRGKVQLNTSGESESTQHIANRLSIQFAPTGGLLTDSINGVGVSQTADNFSSIFEQMQPSDWETGAIPVAQFDPNNPRVEKTSMSQTYSAKINQDLGTTVFVEADATRKAKTLADMSPSLDIGGFSEAFTGTCACNLNRTSWLSVLPLELIQTVTIGETDPTTGDFRPADFFLKLKEHLSEQFSKNYSTYNANRENIYTGKSKNLQTSGSSFFTGNEQDNILGSPGSPLFDRAALGDPDAIRALQNDANFQFGLSSDSLSNFKKTVEEKKSVGQDITTQLNNDFSNIDTVQLGNDVVTDQPIQPPSLYSPINESNFNSAGKPTYTALNGVKKNI